jgi:hypothetical protein
MSVYNDMAKDAGYDFGLEKNNQLAQQIEINHMIKTKKDE